MGQEFVNESEHRRGLVLGLTLAEILILLLFLLLLALGVKLRNLSRENVVLHPLVAEIQAGIGVTVDIVLQRLARMQELEQQVTSFAERNAQLRSELGDLQFLGPETAPTMKALEPILRAAARIKPDDPPSVLRRAMAIVEAVGMDIDPDHLKAASELATKNADAATTIVRLQEEGDRFRRERDNLMRRGNGLTYPSRWTDPDGKSEDIFEVTIRDSGLTLKDSRPDKATDPAWKYVDPFPRGSEIDERRFIEATKKLFDYSEQRKCRFVAAIRDDTGPTSKERYKHLREVVERHFYLNPLKSNTPAPSLRTAQRRPSRNTSPDTKPDNAAQSPPLEIAPSVGRSQMPSGVGGPFVPAPTSRQ